MFDDNVLPKIRHALILHNLRHPSIEHTKHLILWYERRLLTFEIGIRSAIRENHPRRLARRRHIDRRNITPSMKPLPAIPGKTRLPVVRVHPRACEKPFRRVQ